MVTVVKRIPMFSEPASIPIEEAATKSGLGKAVVVKKLYKILDKSIFNPVTVLHVKNHMNITSDKNAQVEIIPLYRVLEATYPGAKREYTIVTKDWDLKTGICNDVCFKRISESKAKRMHNSASWCKGGAGSVYYITTPKVKTREFVKLFKNQSKLTWKEVVDYWIDGTGQMDPRLLDVVKSSVIWMPLTEYSLWQPYNAHSYIITNTHTGKTISYRRAVGSIGVTDYSTPGIIGGMNKDGIVSVGKLAGTGLLAFEEIKKLASIVHRAITSDLMTYMTNGEINRTLVEKINTIGCKTLLFFTNLDLHWDLNGLYKLLILLNGEGQLDAIGSRLGFVLYGNDFSVITSNESDPIHNKIRFIVNELQKEKHSKIQKIFHSFKHWLDAEDVEYNTFWDDAKTFVMEPGLKLFLNGFKLSFQRIKMAALRKNILENLLDLYELSILDFIEKIKQDVYLDYEKFKMYNYRSFEFLFTNKKAQVFEMLKKGHNYSSLCMTGLRISLPMFNRWEYEYKKLVEAGKIRFDSVS